MKLRTRKERAEFVGLLADISYPVGIFLAFLPFALAFVFPGRSSTSPLPSTGNPLGDLLAGTVYAFAMVIGNVHNDLVIGGFFLYIAAWWLWVQAGDEDPQTPADAKGASS